MNDYYNKNYKSYIENTINCEMNEHYKKFLKHIPKKSLILDVGFGSGRDMIYFNNLGYNIEGIDTASQFVYNMKNKNYNVILQSIEYIEYSNKYDGIWACASLLHIKRNKLNDVFKKINIALKNNGILYCSFKYGDMEIIKDERYFNYINEDIIKLILSNNNFQLIELYISNDVRIDRKNEKWINIIAKKL